MAFFKDIKKNIQNESVPTPTEQDSFKEPQKDNSQNKFEFEEARYMLNLIAKSDFKGSDVQVVYEIALKLQNILQDLK